MIAGPAEFLLNVNVLLPQDGKISGIGATLAATKTNFVSYFAPCAPGLSGVLAGCAGWTGAGLCRAGQGRVSVSLSGAQTGE